MPDDPRGQQTPDPRSGTVTILQSSDDNRTSRLCVIAGTIITIILIVVFGIPWIAELISGHNNCSECITFLVNAGVSQPDNTTIVVTFLGGIGHDSVESMTATVTDSTGYEQSRMVGLKRPFSWRDHIWFWDLIYPPDTLPELYSLPVGENITFSGAFSGKDHVVILVHTWDRKDTEIYDNYV